MKDHIADRAGFLAALSADDAERRLAEEHARGCSPCREALAEGQRLVALLQRALPLAVTSPEAPARAERAIPKRAAEGDLTGGDSQAAARRVAWVTAGAVVIAWLFQLMVGSGFVVTLRSVLVSLAVLAVALAVVTFVRGRGRLAVTTVVATSALFAYLSGTAAGFEPGIGIRCSFRELWAAAISWAIVALVARRAGVAFGRWNATAVAAAGALAAHAGQHLACEVPHSDAHLLIFHFGAVVLAALVGAAAAERRAPAAA
jgi:hypothetical protein